MLYCLGQYGFNDCPIKEYCKRYVNKPENTQNIFKDLPLERLNNNEFKCDYWISIKENYHSNFQNNL